MSSPDQDLAARLTAAARPVTQSLTTDDRAAIRRYQARDRTYELVAAVLRGQLIAETFVSTTIYRQVAIDEFTRPPGPGGPALLEVEAPAGTPGLWLPPAGDPDLAYQGELLLLAKPASPSGASERMHVSSFLDCEVLT